MMYNAVKIKQRKTFDIPFKLFTLSSTSRKCCVREITSKLKFIKVYYNTFYILIYKINIANNKNYVKRKEEA